MTSFPKKRSMAATILQSYDPQVFIDLLFGNPMSQWR
jgi:hypothetical protein